MRIEPKVGEIFILPNGKKVVCVEISQPDAEKCNLCAFQPGRVSLQEKIHRCGNYRCISPTRMDDKEVYFEFINKQDYDDRS